MFLETLKANIIILLFFGVIGFLAYWGVTSLDLNPAPLESQNSDVRPTIVNEPAGSSSVSQSSSSGQSTSENTPTSTSSSGSTSSGENSELRSAIEKLITDNVFMKAGSRGTRVGTIQEFLNLYNGTDSLVDNDFGPTTENQVRAFQRSEGLTADGQTGPNTYRKMIEWLDKQ